MTGCTLTGNLATNGNGGRSSSLGGNGTGVTVTASTFSGNHTSNAGGAIFSVVDGGSGAGDTVTVSNSTFTGNSASNGGAVYNPDGGTFVLNGCTLSGNTAADAYGGAIFNLQGGAMTISAGTIDNNSADRGGGIYNFGALTVNTSTLAGNSSPDDGGGLFNESLMYTRSCSMAAPSAATPPTPRAAPSSTPRAPRRRSPAARLTTAL